jgi:hypothetical protein
MMEKLQRQTKKNKQKKKTLTYAPLQGSRERHRKRQKTKQYENNSKKKKKKKIFFTFFYCKNGKRQKITKIDPGPTEKQKIPAGKIDPGQTQYMATTFSVQSFPLTAPQTGGAIVPQ